jgi:PhnB protein
MPINNLHPYIALPGSAAEAIDLYTRVLGAKVEALMHWGDMPGGNCAAADKTRVMHSELNIGGRLLSVSDSMPGATAPETGNIQVCLNFDEPDSLTQAFEGLSQGGTVSMPVQDTFWGAKFGMLTDRFGVRWMFNCMLAKEAARPH